MCKHDHLPSAATAGITRHVTLYNARRPHSSLADQTPDAAYFAHVIPQSLSKAAWPARRSTYLSPQTCSDKRSHFSDAVFVQVTYRPDKSEGSTAGDVTLDALEFFVQEVADAPAYALRFSDLPAFPYARAAASRLTAIASRAHLGARAPTRGANDFLREANMAQNMGGVDRGIRVLLGIGLVLIVFVGPKTNWGWLGLIPLATAAFGNCPLYSVFGWSTKPTSPAKT